MINPFAEINWKPDRKAKRTFALSLMIGLPCVALVFLIFGYFKTGSWVWRPGFSWLAGGGFALGAVLWLLPMIARPFYMVWYFAACCIGFVVSNLLMSLVFYLVVTPIGFVMRTAGRLSFRKGFDRSKTTYWQKPDKVVDLRDYYRQF